MFLTSLSKKWYVHRSVGLFLGPVTAHCSACLFLWKLLAVFLTMALWYSLRSGDVTALAGFFLLRTALSTHGLLCFHISLVFFKFCKECHWSFDEDSIKAVDSFCWYNISPHCFCQSRNIGSSYEIYPCLCFCDVECHSSFFVQNF